MKTPLNKVERLERMRENIARFPHLKRLPGVPHRDRKGLISICGFGPSLLDTWNEIKVKSCVMSTSGAHDFLISKGIIPKYHVETDAREHKVEFVRNSHPDVIYLINSHCHPKMFEILRNRKVIMWHGFTDDDAQNQIATLEEIEPGARLICGGTNVGMRAIVVARDLGYKRFELHGMDCSYRGDQQWAGQHFTIPHSAVKIEVEGRVFDTSDLMMQSTDDFFNQMRMLQGCSFRIYGDGLLEARMQMFMRDRQKALTQGWWRPVNFVLNDAIPAVVGAGLISEEYRAMNSELHKSIPAFGTSGAKRTAEVIALHREVGGSVLDYGCGKSALADSLPFPIWEYDPAIPGKNKASRPADLVVCTDVLEHIEPECLHAVLADLQRLTLRTGYLVISTIAAIKTLPDGRNAHLIQRSAAWWRDVIAEYFVVDKWEVLNGEVRAVVNPKIAERKAA